MKTLIRMAAVMLAAAAVSTANAAPPVVSIEMRPLTPQDIKDYGLTNVVGIQGAAGLSSVGLGQPAYLEVLATTAVATNITNVTWTLGGPVGSQATLQTSPLGTNVPTFRPRERTDCRVVDRRMLRPDAVGQYVVTVKLDSATKFIMYGATNYSATLTNVISGGTYVGLSKCLMCHAGGPIAENIAATFTNTPHASFFKRAISGTENSHYGANCISCHTVGYDTNTNAVNGGFDDVAKQLGWTFPNNITNLAAAATNWASMPAKLQDLANIQCENCHGPGSQHMLAAITDTNTVTWPSISKATSFGAGSCGQCHDSKNNHVRSAEWNISSHANATRTPAGAGREACGRCHTAQGFARYAGIVASGATYTTNNVNTTYEAITCAACHDPHSDANPAQLRLAGSATLDCGVTVTNAGTGAVCMNCHQSRNGAAANSIDKYPLGLQTWAGGSAFGVHDNTAADMLAGVNGYTYGLDIPSSAHRQVVSNACVGCHMQPVASTDPGWLKVGDHTFKMAYEVVSGGKTNTVDQTAACEQCHGSMEEFSLKRADYDGDGTIDGVQTEVKHLLDKLSTMLPNSTYQSNATKYVADGLVKSPSVKTNWPAKFLKAAYNWQFVNVEGSMGIHNRAYAVGLLKASIADLSGDYNNDGLPDDWQIANFGSLTNKNSAPSATPAGDGIPNWLKYQLQLNPNVAGMTVPDGVVWVGANGTSLVNPPGTNTVLKIYTAAEIAFDTEQGKKYQIQGIPSIGGTWSNVGTPITGTGAPISYVTPLRKGEKQFYRVMVNP